MNKKGICPVCYSDNIEYGDLNIADDDTVFYSCECNECHSIWDEVYKAVNHRDLFPTACPCYPLAEYVNRNR